MKESRLREGCAEVEFGPHNRYGLGSSDSVGVTEGAAARASRLYGLLMPCRKNRTTIMSAV